MKVTAIYWGYLSGEEHLTEEQFAKVDFGNPAIDTEFITFDPLASSFFEGKYYSIFEKKHSFPHRNLPAMRSETLVMYKETNIKITDPPVDLNTPVGIFLCFFSGEPLQIRRAKDYIGEKINLRFSPVDFDLEQFFLKLEKTRLKITPRSLTIGNLELDKDLVGNFEVLPKNKEQYIENLKLYKPKIQELKIMVQEVNLKVLITINNRGIIKTDPQIIKQIMQKTILDVAARSVYTGSIE